MMARIADYARIDAAIPTLRWLHEHEARTIVLSHLGRPGGKRDIRFSLRPVAQALSDRLGIAVALRRRLRGRGRRTGRCRGCSTATCCCSRTFAFIPRRNATIPNSQNGLRGSANSTSTMPSEPRIARMPRPKASPTCCHMRAGFLMEAELAALSRLVDRPSKPFVCAIGGAKIKDKIDLLQRTRCELVDAFCIGGGMANTLLAAAGTTSAVRSATTISSLRGASFGDRRRAQRCVAFAGGCGRRPEHSTTKAERTSFPSIESATK